MSNQCLADPREIRVDAHRVGRADYDSVAAIQPRARFKMKKKLIWLPACVFLGMLTGCGHRAPEIQTPDPTTQPEAQAALFERTCDRLRGLIASKDYKQAQQSLDSLKNYKLTEEQKKIVDQLQAQIPKAQ